MEKDKKSNAARAHFNIGTAEPHEKTAGAPIVIGKSGVWCEQGHRRDDFRNQYTRPETGPGSGMTIVPVATELFAGSAGSVRLLPKNMSITLRDVCENDAPFLFSLYRSTREEEVAAWGWPQAQVDAFLQIQFKAQSASYAIGYPGAQHKIVMENGEPVGRWMVYRLPHEVRIVDVSLLPTVRNRGIGSRLIRELMDECRESGRKLKLQVLCASAARNLYLRLGFRPTGHDSIYEQMEWTPAVTDK